MEIPTSDAKSPLLGGSPAFFHRKKIRNTFLPKSPQLVREQYLARLGYTPLIFQNDGEVSRRKQQQQNGGKEIELGGSVGEASSLIPPAGSIRGSIFNLAGATLGAGALSLPYAVAVSGLAFAVAELTIAAILTIYTVRLLIRAGEITGLKSYEDLALYCFGKKVAIFVEMNILVFCYGISVAYLVTLGDILAPLGELCFGEGSIFSERWLLMSFFCCVIMLPLSLLRDISSLQFSSILGVLSIIFLVISVSIRSIMITAEQGIRKDLSWGINLNSAPDFMLSVPIVMFAFTCQVNVFSIYTELQRPNIRRMNKVVDRAIFVSVFIYLTIGVFAYLAFGPTLTAPDKKGNILLSFPLHDILMAFSRAAITFTVSVAFPLNIFPCRFTLEMMFFANSTYSVSRHAIMTCGLVISALIVAIFCPSINIIFGIIGGTCSSIVCFCFPAAFMLKICKGSLFGPHKIGPLLLLVGATILGLIGTGVTIWSNFIK